MTDTVTIRVSGTLRNFINERAGEHGLYESASEYLRDLIRHDYEKAEQHKWDRLSRELQPGMQAPQSEFEPFDPDTLIQDAKAKHGKHN